MKKQGKIINIDFQGLRSFIDSLPVSTWSEKIFPDSLSDSCSKLIAKAIEDEMIIPDTDFPQFKGIKRTVQKQIFEKFTSWIKYTGYDSVKHNSVKKLEKLFQYARTYGQSIEYIIVDDTIVLLTAAGAYYAFPVSCVQIQAYHNYSDTPVQMLGNSSDLSGMLPAISEEKTENSIRSEIMDKQKEIQDALNEIAEEKEAQRMEIERMKAEIEAMYASKFELLNQKKAELEMTKQKLSNELFVLETQIYGIRCYFGEVVSFTAVSDGRSADQEIPVVLYQKIRFLDEELAKWMSIYGFDGENTDMFEELIRTRSDMREFFFPGEKSISLIRISKDGKLYQSQYAPSTDGKQVIFNNIMKEYALYHGERLGILVRNGENCYIGWTDEDQISISDGNVFLTPQEKRIDEEIPAEETDSFGHTKERKGIRTDKKEIASRYFLFSIMQGVIDHSKLISLPAGVKVTADSPYVQFSMADAWLKDTRYGTLTDILKKYNGLLRKGDHILTLSGLGAEGHKYSRYSNDRGIGRANRTHDVYASNNTIYPVNLVVNTTKYLYTFEKRDYKNFSKEYGKWKTCSYRSEKATFEEFVKTPGTCWIFPEETQFRNIKQQHITEQNVFISLEKDPNWRTGAVSTANFQLYSDEYINLTFLNTDLIRYVLTNGELGTDFKNRNFSSFIPYLNHAMEVLKEREEKEKELILKYVSNIPDNWRMQLSDWKIAYNIHKISDYQAKRFVNKLMK